MLPKRMLFPLFIIGMAVTILGFMQRKEIATSSIADLHKDPLSYDGKEIRLSGWLASGHVGVFLYAEDRKQSVRLRSPDEVDSNLPMHAQKDKLFEEFWKLAEKGIQNPEGRVHVDLVGVVRILKVDGKPAKDFYVFGQFPVEVVTTQILKITSK